MIIKIPIKSSKQDISNFLVNMKRVLNSPSFSINRNFLLIKSKKATEKAQYSTPYTIVDLEYDADDVVARLKELEVKNYSETLWDRDDSHPPLLFVFGKDIHGRLIYIKVKLKGDQMNKVLCVSFHYAEHPMTFPYA